MPEPGFPSILLLHDGELDDVRALLVSLGTGPVSLSLHDRPATAGPQRWDLIVTTARRALAHPECLAGGDGELPPARVVFASEDSPTLRRQLRATGFDYLVRRPVDPGALRLLFLRLLYLGPERRSNERYPSGREVTYRLGHHARHAILGDLSESGCRLLHAAPAKPGQRIVVEVPADEGGRTALSVEGQVIRCVPPTTSEDGSTLAVAFDELGDGALARLREALRTSIVGSDAAPRRTHEARESSEPPDRRREPRAAFRRRVIALRAEADRVLMGCDLSVTGMRAESHPNLAVGDRMRLAIYAESGAEPWIVGAVVVRNDREGGLALRFDELPHAVSRRLEAFVASLPPLEALQRGEAGSLGAVLTQILE
jgi:hypothetical protein